MKKILLSFIMLFSVFILMSCDEKDRHVIDDFLSARLYHTTYHYINDPIQYEGQKIFLDFIEAAVMIKTYESYEELFRLPKDQMNDYYESSFFDEHVLIVIPYRSYKKHQIELNAIERLVDKLYIDIVMRPSLLREEYYIDQNFSYCQAIIEVNQQDVTDFTYSLTEETSVKHLVYHTTSEERLLDNTYELFITYEDFYDFIIQIDPLYENDELILDINTSTFDDYFMFVYEKWTLGAFHLILKDAFVYEVQVTQENDEIIYFYTLYVIYDQYAHAINSWNFKQISIIVLPRSIYHENMYVNVTTGSYWN